MKRKVIQIAQSTQLISLPRKWGKRFNIKKGDELDVIDKGAYLVIKPESGERDLLKREMNLEGIEESLKYLLHGYYKIGYNEVVFRFRDEATAEHIQKILREEVIGFEIVEQNSKSCVVRSVAGALPSEYDSMLNRAGKLNISMFEGILEVFNTGNILTVKSLIYMESTNNKYTSFCKRVINKGELARDRLMQEYNIISGVERLADEMKYVCYEILRAPNEVKNAKRELKDLLKECHSLLVSTDKLLEQYDLSIALKNIRKRKELILRSMDMRRHSNQREVRFLHYVINICNHILTINRAKMEMEL